MDAQWRPLPCQTCRDRSLSAQGYLNTGDGPNASGLYKPWGYRPVRCLPLTCEATLRQASETRICLRDETSIAVLRLCLQRYGLCADTDLILFAEQTHWSRAVTRCPRGRRHLDLAMATPRTHSPDAKTALVSAFTQLCSACCRHKLPQSASALHLAASNPLYLFHSWLDFGT